VKRVTLFQFHEMGCRSDAPVWVDHPVLDVPETMLGLIANVDPRHVGALSFVVTGGASDALVRGACRERGIHAVWVNGRCERLNPPGSAP
jgi:hypothetical protein